METKAYWLSFADDTGHLGCCQVKVDETDVADAASIMAAKDQWLAGALRKAHRLGINPGGSVMSQEFPADFPTPHPFDVLMSKADVERYDAACTV